MSENVDMADYAEESEDELVAEFDICLAGALKDSLQLLQYPLRPRFRPYGDQGVLKSVEMAVNSKHDKKGADESRAGEVAPGEVV
jgi:hypothetical protein